MPEDPAGSLAAELARMPDLVERLAAEHTPDESGRCRGCRLPGYGSAGDRWPCTLATLAAEAQRIMDRRTD
jgi:hypothetical protein